MLTRQAMLTGPHGVAGAGALAHPDSAGPEHAPQLAVARRIGPVTRAQGEILVVVRHRSGLVGREPVIWVGPLSGQPRIDPGPADAVG